MKNFTAAQHTTWKRELLENVQDYTDRDHLTDLYNRRYFNKKSRRNDYRKKRGITMSLSIMAIDNFHNINDDPDHDCSDHLLVELSKLLTSNIGMFVSARHGGGDLAILMPKLTAEKSARLTD